jgi:LacI family transcriptional regulator
MSRLQDIARELDVSVSLVSKVLNGRLGTTGANPKTVRAIERAAQKLHYRKHSSAAALATGRQNVVGLFLHSIGVEGSGVSEAIVRGVSAALAARGQRLMLQYFLGADEFRAACPEVGRHAMDGLIVGGVHHHELVPELAQVQDAGIPVVTIHDQPLAGEALPNVGSDQVAVGRIATEHLIALGCRRIAHVKVDSHRASGYHQALSAAGLPARPELFHVARRYDARSAEEALAAFDAAGAAFDGIVAQSDQQAAAVVSVLLRRGVRVPDQVKVIGVDDSPFCEFFPVRLSSVSNEHFARGRRAVEMLMDRLAGRPVASVQELPVLRPRESTIGDASEGGRGAGEPAGAPPA